MSDSAGEPGGAAPRFVGRSGAPLGNNTKKPSRASSGARGKDDRDGKRRATRSSRFRLREALREVSTLRRVIRCGLLRIDGKTEPEVRCKTDEKTGSRVAHFTRLQLCGSIWVCPVCGPHIRQERALDVDAACARWIARYGVGAVMLLTLTLPHDFGEPLADLLATVKAAFASLTSGRGWQDDKAAFRLMYYVRAHDCTVGPNGWHPHLHIVLLALRPLTNDELAALTTRLHLRWADAVEKRGHRRPSREHGIQLEQARSRTEVARYVCQVVTGSVDRPTNLAYEVARGDLKTSRRDGYRTPWEVLASVSDTGDCHDLALWHEWERATFRVQAIRWSKALRADVGLAKEKTDEEVVAVDVGGEVVYVFKGDEWVATRETRGARALVLDVAECQDGEAVAAYVAELLSAWRIRRAEDRRRASTDPQENTTTMSRHEQASPTTEGGE